MTHPHIDNYITWLCASGLCEFAQYPSHASYEPEGALHAVAATSK